MPIYAKYMPKHKHIVTYVGNICKICQSMSNICHIYANIYANICKYLPNYVKYMQNHANIR